MDCLALLICNRLCQTSSIGRFRSCFNGGDAKPQRRAGCLHCHISAAHDDHALAQLDAVPQVVVQQQIHRRNDPIQRYAFDVQPPALHQPHPQVNGVEDLAQL